MRALKNILLVLSTGYIFVYFSEHLFWARLRPGDSAAGWLGTWIAYSLMAFVFLTLVSRFQVRNIWALFLAGAAFGWICEGIVVQTAYDTLPLSVSFTGLAWHALLTVWVGWYALRRAFLAADPWMVPGLATVIGLCHGLWAIHWWVAPDGGISPVAAYAAFSFATTVLVILAFRLADWSSSTPFNPSRWTTGFVAAVFTLYFFFVTVPAAPPALVILPGLFALVFLGLRKNRLAESKGSLLDAPGGRAFSWKYASLLALPAASTFVYALAAFSNVRWHTNWILYLITTPLGFILFGVSLYKVWRRKPIASPTEGTIPALPPHGRQTP